MKHVLLAILALLTCFSCVVRAAERKPNIVFILIDDMGWTDLGCMGSDLYQTPNIDRLASQSVKFSNAYSACTVCSPTRAALLTGKYPARLHLTDWIAGHERPRAKLQIPDWKKFLALEEVTIASALKPAGYASASIGKWHLGPPGEHLPTHHGFDQNIGGFNAGQPPSYFAPYKIPTLTDGPAGEYLTDRCTDEACRFIETHREHPFFLYLPFYCVHTPLQAKKEYIAEIQKRVNAGMTHTNATYAAMIQSLDDGVGRILSKLDELKLSDNTIVIFTSDNGGLIPVTRQPPLRAGKGSAYEGGVRVPLFVKWPGVTPAGKTCDEPVITTDFYPTLLEITGTPGDAKHNQTLDGKSLVPLLRDPAAKLERKALFWHYPHYHPGGASPYGAVRAGDWRLVEFYEDNHVELYNLKDDIGEKTDLAAKSSEKARELHEMLASWRTSVGAQMPTPNPKYDPDKK